MDPEVTFVQRWGAVRFVSEQLQERCRQEAALLEELQDLLSRAELDRLRRQGGRIARLRQDVERLARGRCTGRDLAHAAQELIQALRLWYAEIEFSLRDTPVSSIGARASQILNQLNYRSAITA
jgi:hypothetical protein